VQDNSAPATPWRSFSRAPSNGASQADMLDC
jgi:hypothetical protein